MKTALQQFIEHIEKNHSDIIFKYPNLLSSQDLFIDKEKDQIRKAFNEGFEHADEIGSEEYYNEFWGNK